LYTTYLHQGKSPLDLSGQNCGRLILLAVETGTHKGGWEMDMPTIGWSPSSEETIVGKQKVTEDASEELIAVVRRELAKFPGNNNEAKQVIRQRALELTQLIEKFVAEGSKERIATIEAELAEVCADGERSEQEFQSLKNEELRVRNAENERIERYNRATKNLNNVTNDPLTTFHTNKDVKRKLERIADAQGEVDAAQADFAKHPLAIPTIVNAKIAAEVKMNTLAAKARSLRKELASLRCEDAHSTGQQRSGTGLGAAS
jgi:hypothetical protein